MKTVTTLEALNHIGDTVTIKGWVRTQRNMGKISFIDLRDPYSIIQLVCVGIELPKLAAEYVVEVTGEIRPRDPKFINSKLATGTIELKISSLSVISTSQELPFELDHDTAGINEELRLKYRYLDLRTDRMAKNLRLRHRVNQFIRNYMDNEGFIEVETPMLTKGTPEGAREFIVPSRLHAGQFYVLPQSPQQFKQLLMVGGVGKYYQIVRCFRDEDQRGDRQPEFTQLDFEMSFVDQEDVLQLTERLFIELVKAVAPEKHFTATPFPRLTYAEAMEKYQSDKPDLRKDKTDPDELAFTWVLDFPMFEIGKESKQLEAMHHPFTSPLPEDLPLLDKEPLKVRANAYDLVCNGYELSSGSIRIHDIELQTKVFSLLGLSKEVITARFGHMLEAFTYGVPPHGGFAPGIDRVVMILAGEPNIREVIAFPKTGDARDPLMGAPSVVDPNRLADAHIKIEKFKKP